MTDEVLDETHDCGGSLIRVPADDDANPEDAPVVVCPSCLERVRVERSDGE